MAVAGQLGDLLGQRQRGALPLGELALGLFPCGQQCELLLADPALARIVAVHVQTERAAFICDARILISSARLGSMSLAAAFDSASIAS
jgi:hypothetical protein